METLTKFSVSSFAEILEAIKYINREECTFEEFIERRDYFISNKAEFQPFIEKLTINELKKYVYYSSGDKKSRMVSSLCNTVLDSFTLSESVVYSPFEEKYEDALKRYFNKQTPEFFAKWQAERKAKREELLKALTNPETLAEFHTFVSRKGEAALTSEQKAIFDNLRADGSKAIKQREEVRKAEVKAVELEGVEMILKESIHTKKEIPLFVVQLSSRVEKEKYNELNAKAKKLGGYYSSYNKGGAVPGFTFEKKEAAELFMGLQNSDVNAAELKAEVKQEKVLTRAEVLKEKALKLLEEGTEELNRDRNANTSRRATFAAHAEAKASRKITFAKTLISIAEGLENGTIKYLDKINAVSELEELETILSGGKWAHVRTKNLKSDSYEITTETAEYIKYPFPTLYNHSNTKSLLRNLAATSGKALAANRILKRLASTPLESCYSIEGESMLKDFETVFCTNIYGSNKWECERYKNAFASYKRIQRLGLTTIYELRAAVRELINLKQGAKLTPEQLKAQQIRELERTFLNKKIEGFFPTPEALAADIVTKADILEGNTILEPSAGLGHLAEAIAEAYPDNQLNCIEYNTSLANALELKGFEVENADFLQCSGSYDRIIMNPPFENLQDIDHVQHAFNLLNPGGRLVAIMAGNKTGERTKIKEFNEFVSLYGYSEANPAGSFSSAFRPTGVTTITVILDKPFN